MKTLRQILLSVLVLGAADAMRSQTVAATPAVGYFKLTANGTSDNPLSVPLVRRSALLARVAAVGPNTLTLTVTGVADDAFAPGSGTTYYAQFVSGALGGLCFKVIGNAGGVFTLATEGEDLTSHSLGAVVVGAAGDLVRIRPYWSVADVFGGLETTLTLDPVADLTSTPYLASDAILLPDNQATGTEKKALLTIAYLAGAGWRATGNPSADLAAQILPPGVPFIVRRQRAAPAEILVVGYVAPEPFILRVPGLAAGEDRDVAVALAHSLERSLAESGLFSAVPSGRVIQASPDALNVRDLLLEFDAGRSGFAMPAAHRYYVVGAGWFETDAAADDHLLQPGAGYLLRLRGERPACYWVNSSPD